MLYLIFQLHVFFKTLWWYSHAIHLLDEYDYHSWIWKLLLNYYLKLNCVVSFRAYESVRSNLRIRTETFLMPKLDFKMVLSWNPVMGVMLKSWACYALPFCHGYRSRMLVATGEVEIWPDLDITAIFPSRKDVTELNVCIISLICPFSVFKLIYSRHHGFLHETNKLKDT